MLAPLLAICLVGPTAVSLQTDPLVTLRIDAAPVEVVVAKIAEITKQPLKVAASEAGEILALKVTNVPAQRLMTEIAAVTFAEWTRDEAGRLWLSRTPAGNRAAVAVELARNEALYKAALAKRTESLNAHPLTEERASSVIAQLRELMTPPPNGGGQVVQRINHLNTLNAEGPAGRVLTGLLTLIGPTELAKLPEGYCVTFATNPTRTERALPPSAMRVADSYRVDQAVWLRALRRSPGWSDQVRIGQFVAEAYWNRVEPNRTPSLVLSLTKRVPRGHLAADLYLLDQDRRPVTHLSSVIDVATEPEIVTESSKAPIQLRPASLRLARAFARLSTAPSIQKAASSPPLSEDLEQVLVHPETADPLSFVVSDLLVGVAEAKGLNLVASVPDSAFPLTWALGADMHITAGEVVSKANDCHLAIENHDGFLRVRSTTPATSRYATLPRSTLGSFLRVIANGAVSVEEMASYAAKGVVYRERDYLTTPILMAYRPLVAETFSRNDWQTLRLVGNLTDAQRHSVLSGEHLLLSTVSPQARDALDRLIRGPMRPFTIHLSNANPATLDWLAGIGKEPAEVLPDGLASDASFSLRPGKGGLVLPLDSAGSRVRALTAEQVAQELFLRERSGNMRADVLDRVHYVEQSTVTLLATLSSSCSLEQMLSGISQPGPVVAFTDLPADFRATVTRQLKELREMNVGPRSGSGSVPPVK